MLHRPEAVASPAGEQSGKNAFLSALGERVRALRARRGLTRKAVAQAAGISERHLANLEYGEGNISILLLLQVAQALEVPLVQLLGDGGGASAEWGLLCELLAHRDEATLRRVRLAVSELLAQHDAARPRTSTRIALVGLRGAGKTTLGQMLADDLGYPFVEISREVEKLAGCSTSEIVALYGQDAYRRYERRALEEAIQVYPEAVLATPGGLVADSASLALLLTHCTTIWLQAEPQDHMRRVLAQRGVQPPAASAEAMEDLRAILAARAPFYAQAHHRIDTSAQPLEQTFGLLRALVRSLGISPQE